MIPELLLGILLLIGLVVPSGESVHPEANNHLYDPLDPNTVLQCPDTTIEGKDGDTVILPCSTKDKMDISHEEVEWLFEDPTTGEDKTVHTYFQGEDFLHQQRDGTFLFKEELSSGNCSLSLLVTTSQSGTYSCRVGGRLCCTVTLKVKNNTSQMHQDDPESPDKPPSTDGQNKTIGGVVGGVLIIIIIIIAFVVWYRKRRNPLCSPTKPNNPQIYQEVPLQAQQPPQIQENEPVDPNPNGEQIQMNVIVEQDDPADDN